MREGVAAERPSQTVRFQGERLSIGRSNANDVVLDDVNVSRFHAEVVPSAGVLELRDLDSACGTRLDGRPVKRAVIKDGSVIGVGPHRLVFDGSSFKGRDERGALRLDARGVTVRADGKTIVDGISLSVEPGELVAVIGASGAGKSTLVRALAGVSRPSGGEVLLNGEPVTARQTDVGYVPQEEIVHRLLTVQEALEYAARLRLPRDTGRPGLQSTIKRALAELSLERQAGTRIGSLSGGERKRASVASELLHRPSLLFLDEPTTGLDPALESQLMSVFRELAEPGERSVVVVTHATRNLARCDRVAVVARGGRLAFYGPPAEALRFFGVETYDEIYDALERGDWSAAPSPAPPADVPEPGPAGSPRAKQNTGFQFPLLTGRYLRLMLRDGRNLAILFGQVPLIGLAIAFLFKTGLFERGAPDDQVLLLFLLVTTAIWFGCIDGSREFVKERAIARRERHVGVRLTPYIASKAVVLFGLAAVQTAALAFFVLAIRPLEEPAGTYAAVVALLCLTSWVAVGIGLLVSSLASTEDQATSVIPLILIPQLLFAGAIVPVAQMAEPIASISGAVFARWSLAGAGGAVEMNERLGANRELERAAGFGPDFFDLTAGQATGALLGFLLLAFLAAAAFESRRQR